MDAIEVLESLRGLLGLRSQASLAKWLEFKPQHLSRIKKSGLTPEFVARIKERVERLQPELRIEILRRLNTRIPDPMPLPDATSRAKSGWEPPFFEPIEKEAWDWALAGRNHTVVREICGQARRAGLACMPFQDGLDIGGWTTRNREVALHPDPRQGRFGLPPGTRLVLGAAERHQRWRMREAFDDKTATRVVFCETDRGAYFGYATVLKYFLLPGREPIRPERYAIPRGIAYHDVGVVSFGPRKEFYPQENEKHEGAQLVWLAAAQRLANYVGGRFISDLDFRKRLFGPSDPFQAARFGVLLFRVTVVNEGTGSVIRHFEYMLGPDFRPTVTDLDRP